MLKLYRSLVSVVTCSTFNVSINDANARVCSEHFILEGYIQPVISGFGASKPSLKPDAVPSVFNSNSVTKRLILFQNVAN